MSTATVEGRVGRGRLIDRIVRLRAERAARRRRTREFASMEAFGDHLLGDMGFRRDGDSLRRHLARF
jgi:hypothetical protein